MSAIQITDEQLQALIDGKGITIEPPKPKKIKLEGGNWRMYADGSVVNFNTYTDSQLAGAERDTHESATLARNRMVRVNKLSALAHQLGGEREFVSDEDNCYVYKYTGTNCWGIKHRSTHFNPERVYMTESCAVTICEILNAELFDLEYE